MDMKPVPSLP
jgi:hypothetical protein